MTKGKFTLIDKTLLRAMVAALRVADAQKWKLSAESRVKCKFDKTINKVNQLWPSRRKGKTSSTPAKD